MLASPLIIMTIVCSIFSSTIPFQLAIQDKDGSDKSAALIKELTSTSALNVRMLEANEDSYASLRSAPVSLLMIPRGFASGTDGKIPIFVMASMNFGPDSLPAG